MYPESIFALEPSTVRVREVGVGRGDRRSRRDHERGPNEAVVNEAVANVPAGTEPSFPGSSTTPGATSTEAVADRPEHIATTTGMDPRASGSASIEDENVLRGRTTEARSIAQHAQDQAESMLERQDPDLLKSSLTYTTFQQLPFVPPVPSSVLSAAWVIPPLYDDVVKNESPSSQQSASFNFNIDRPTRTVSGDANEPGSTASVPAVAPPLLSPVSLIGGAAQRSSGPPGLFFVTKGDVTGLVTADGKPVIKRPLMWPTERSEIAACVPRIELLVLGGNRTVVLRVSTSSIGAIAVEGGSGGHQLFANMLSIPASTSKSTDREVTWIATHHPTSQLFFAERVGQHITLNSVYAKM